MFHFTSFHCKVISDKCTLYTSASIMKGKDGAFEQTRKHFNVRAYEHSNSPLINALSKIQQRHQQRQQQQRRRQHELSGTKEIKAEICDSSLKKLKIQNERMSCCSAKLQKRKDSYQKKKKGCLFCVFVLLFLNRVYPCTCDRCLSSAISVMFCQSPAFFRDKPNAQSPLCLCLSDTLSLSLSVFLSLSLCLSVCLSAYLLPS